MLSLDFISGQRRKLEKGRCATAPELSKVSPSPRMISRHWWRFSNLLMKIINESAVAHGDLERHRWRCYAPDNHVSVWAQPSKCAESNRLRMERETGGGASRA